MNLGTLFKNITAPSEETLILRAKNGDREAFGKLYKTYIDQIFRYIYFKIITDRYTAEDITEEVFIKVMKNLNKFNSKEGTFKAWIYAIARNQSIDFMRKNKNLLPITENVVSSENIEEKLINKMEVSAVKNAIRKLKRAQREVLTLSYINGLKNDEICQLIKKTDLQVRAIKHRALANLRKEINGTI